MTSTIRPPRSATSRKAARESKPSFVVAPMRRRIAGAAIDMILLIAVAGILASMLEGATSGVTRIRIDAESGERIVSSSLALPAWLPLLLLVVLTALYTVPLMALWGRTLGGWIVGIRCVRADSGAPLGWSLSVRRWGALYGVAGVLGFAPIIGPFAWLVTLVVGLSPLWDGARLMRGYADYLGDDVVVMAGREASTRR